jgi:hypothetical protein
MLISLNFGCEASTTKKNYEDDRIGVTFEKIEKADKYPAEWRLEGYRYSLPGKENVYLVVNYTIVRIKDIHLVNCGRDFKKDVSSVLRTANGKEYKPMECILEGFKKKDQNSSTYHPEVEQGAKGMLLFLLPKDEIAIALSFVYVFQYTWEDKDKQVDKIDIVIPAN